MNFINYKSVIVVYRHNYNVGGIMNWVLSILFYFLFFIECLFLGRYVLLKFEFRRNYVEIYFITGYLFFFLLMSLINIPAHFFHVSWIVYFSLALVYLISINGWIIWKQKGYIKNLLAELKILKINDILKNNWIGIVFILLFTYFSLSNQLAFLNGNYDDIYYIGKSVNLIGADHLYLEDYMTGELLIQEPFDIVRFFNTYELTYSFLSVLSGIYTPFFIRIPMAAVNYTLFYFSVTCFSRMFISRKLSQFSIVVFFAFLLPEIYFYSSVYQSDPFYSYDLWQFTNAAYYGGSVIRMSSYFILWIFLNEILKNYTVRHLVFGVLICGSFISFSTVFFTVFAYFAIGGMLTVMVALSWKMIRKGDYKKATIFGLCFLLVLVGMFMLEKAPVLIDLNYSDSLNEFGRLRYSNFDLRMYIIFLTISILLLSKTRTGSLFAFNFIITYMITYPVHANMLNYLFSVKVFFVYLRWISTVQYLILAMTGIFILQILSFIKIKRVRSIIVHAGSIGYILLILFTFNHYEDSFLENTEIASGVSPNGWSFSRILNLNEKMIPQSAYEIGELFNEMDFGNYALLTPSSIPYHDNSYDPKNLILSSNRIELFSEAEKYGLNQEQMNAVQSFLSGENLNSEQIINLLKDSTAEYILGFGKRNMELLEESGNFILMKEFDNQTDLDEGYLLKIIR